MKKPLPAPLDPEEKAKDKLSQAIKNRAAKLGIEAPINLEDPSNQGLISGISLKKGRV